MKKLLIWLLAAILLVNLTGCNVLDYNQAMNHYKAGEYAQAAELFQALGDYADSPGMAATAGIKAAYQAAEAFYEAGDYRQALPLYRELALYEDSPVKAIDCKYKIALESLSTGTYAEAVPRFQELGAYLDSQDRLLQAKWEWLCSRGELATETEGTRVSLTPQKDGSILFLYESQGQVLGMPYESRVTMVLNQGLKIADFQAEYLSTSTTTIRETSSGTVDLRGFTGDERLPVQTFSQTSTYPDGTESFTTDPVDSLMMELMLTEAARAMAQALPELIEKSLVPMTVNELGFTALMQEETQ